MSDGSTINGNGSRADRFADNTWAKIVARYIMPALIIAVGSMGAYILNDLRDTVKEIKTDGSNGRAELWKAQSETSKAQAAISSDLKVLSERVGENRVRSDDAD